MLIAKSYSQIEKSAREALENHTPFQSRASDARHMMIVRVLSRMIAEYYRDLDFNTSQSFISRASGVFLDLIAELFSLVRLPLESDDEFRYRIVSHLKTHQGATEEAIRLAALSAPNVRDIVLRPYTRGTGSGTVYVITHQMSQLDAAVEEVQRRIDPVAAFGCRVVAEPPRLMPVSMQLVAVLKTGTSDTQRRQVIQSVRLAARRFVDGLNMGEDLVISRFFDAVMEADSRLIDLEIHGVWIDGRSHLVQNVRAHYDEKFYIAFAEDLEVS